MRYRHYILILFSQLIFSLNAQDVSMHNINLQANYLFEIPGGDLSDRYGVNSKFEFKFEYLSKAQLAYYIKGGIRINQNVKEDVLAPIRTSEGFVIGVNGIYADVFGRKRGYDLGLGIDKLFPLDQNYFRIGLAGVFTTHWIKIVDDSRSLAVVVGDSRQLFDRFVSGFGVEENIQYQFNISNTSGLVIGFQIGQFFTKEHRFNLIGNNTAERRLDLYFGIKLGYLLALKSFEKTGTIFY